MKLTPGEMLRIRQLAQADPTQAGPAWRALSEAQTRIAAERTGGVPLTVTAAPGITAPAGGAPGLWAPGAAKILIDGDLLRAAPDEIDPLGSESDMRDLAKMHGVLLHECGHAKHTREERSEIFEEKDDVIQASVLLEEIRMEAQVVRHRPDDARWLRASAHEIIAKEPSVADGMSACAAAVLIGGRVHAGSLEEDDFAPAKKLILEHLDQADLDAVLEICDKTTKIADDDITGLLDLAQRLAELFPEKPEGCGQSVVEALGKALADAAEDALEGGAEEIEQIMQDQAARGEIERALEEMAQQLPGSASGSAPEKGERYATDQERRARNDLTQKLRRVRWRERVLVERASAMPPGRLNSRQALHRSAEISQGSLPQARPWQTKRRRSVDMPKLTCGILVDTSGSMHGARHELAGSLWALGHAVYDNGGRVAAALFGDTAELLWGVEAPPRHVLDILPSGGTQFVADGIELVDEALVWQREDGPRMLVIVSDGWWGNDGSDLAIADVRARGIHVMQLGVRMAPQDHGADQVLSISSAADLPEVVGESAARALQMW